MIWLLAIPVLLVGAICVEAYLKRNTYRPLARQHEGGQIPKRKPPLGMEATDLELVRHVTKENQALQQRHTKDRRI